MSNVCVGNYCSDGTDVVFKHVLRGILPIQWLAKLITGKCTREIHTTACIACFHCQSFYISAQKIRHFLHVHQEQLALRDNVLAEIESMAMLLYAWRKHTWISACRDYVRHSPILQKLFDQSMQQQVFTVSLFKEYILCGHVSQNYMPKLPLLCKTEADRYALDDVYWYLMFIDKKELTYVPNGPCFYSIYNTVMLCLLRYNIPPELRLYIWQHILQHHTKKV